MIAANGNTAALRFNFLCRTWKYILDLKLRETYPQFVGTKTEKEIN